jgi:prolyl-tRNA editing enzyme YbaK/EbsC (Cys-tRNA(Pro) deacylase)
MIPERVARQLAAHGLAAMEFEPGSTATAELAAARLGVRVGQIAKSLLFVARNGALTMLLCPGDRKASSAKLKAILGAKSRMARPDETVAATGYEPGGVCPFGIEPGIRILIDEGLSRHQTIYPAAGTPASGVPMTFAQLVAITAGEVGDFTTAADGERERPTEEAIPG